MTKENIGNLAWTIPRRSPILNDNGIHVWCVNLQLPSSKIDELGALLSVDEIARANRFRFPQHKKRFIAARGILRQLLGNYLASAPDSLNFAYESRGKPSLNNNKNTDLQFNISHSQDYALMGFTRKHLIGVDIEFQRPMPDCLKIAQRFFSTKEFNLLKDVAEDKQTQLFFQLWTAKEAYLKAIGTGLSGSLSNVEIAFDLHHRPYIKSLESQNNQDWSLHSCTPAEGYLGAIAVNTNLPSPQICFWQWQ